MQSVVMREVACVSRFVGVRLQRVMLVKSSYYPSFISGGAKRGRAGGNVHPLPVMGRSLFPLVSTSHRYAFYSCDLT